MDQRFIKKVSWQTVREHLQQVNPELTGIIDNISPSRELGLYLAGYPYGDEIIKFGKLQLPTLNGRLAPLKSSNIPVDIKEDLSYNLGSNPVTVVLKNSLEIFYILDNHTIPLYGIVPAGAPISTWYVLSDFESHGPAFLWNITSGARSIFLLSKISDAAGRRRLERNFNLQLEKPRTMLDHWRVFKDIANHSSFSQPWATELLFFGKKWFENLSDPAFEKLQLYLFKKAWRGSNFYRHQYIWKLVFSLIKKELNIRPEPYIFETVEHLFTIGLGEAPGFATANDNLSAPIDGLKQVFDEIYQIKKYPPIFMLPEMFDFNKKNRPVYYSLSYPTIMQFSQRSNEATKLKDLYLISSLEKKLSNALIENELNIAGTPMHRLPSVAKYDYFHTDGEHSGINDTKLIMPGDDNFKTLVGDLDFPYTSQFLRGVVRISSL